MEYLDALELQRSLHGEIAEGHRENTLVLVEHPSVYTAGKRTQDHERPHDGTPVIDVDRGGKITWHGPGQLVGYPIVKLKQATNVVGFVRTLETALINICAELGLETQQYCERSGVWVRDENGDPIADYLKSGDTASDANTLDGIDSRRSRHNTVHR